MFIDTVDSLSHPLYYPLYASIVVCYIRPFTNNKPFGSIPKRYSKFNGISGLKELHAELLKYRHEFIAHNDMTLRKALIVPEGVPFGKVNDKDIKFTGIGTAINNDFHPLEKFKRIYDLILYNESRIEKDIKKLTQSLYGGMQLPNQKFEIRIDEGL